MYPCSNEFHAAVANGNPQKALLIFNDAVFTNDDINVEVGIEFDDHFNLEEDIAIGQTPSNEIRFSLFNDGRYLNDYTFGEFLATLGVLIVEDTYQQFGSVVMNTNNARWIGSGSAPFLRRNGSAVSAQPSFAVKSLMGYDNKVWAFSGTGQYAVYDDKTGSNITAKNPVNAFMRNKSKGWDGKGMFYNKDARKLFIYEAGYRSIYEFVPFGWFIAERPKAPDVILIDMDCLDFMQKFEKDMPTPAQLGMTYPATVKTLLQKMCAYVGVELGTDSFINCNAILSAEPEEFRSATMRDVLKWIAEAGAGNARFNRDGKLVIDWIRNSGLVLTPNDYETFDPYWYETKKVTKLYNRASNGSYDKSVGTGDEGYLIQDNPILKGVS